MQNIHVSTKFRCHRETILGKCKWNTGKKKTIHDNKFHQLKG